VKINCSYDELVEIHKLVPNPKNPNIHPEDQIERLSQILDYQGQRHPVIVSKRSGFIVVGHGRLEAIKKLSWEKCAVNYQDFDSEAQEYAFVVSDNAIAEWATLDLGAINTELGDLGPDFDINLLGIENFTLEPADKEGNGDEDSVPEVKFAISRPGDVWLLGRHRVLCGDSTMISDVEKLMNGNKADFGFCDPPYNLGFSYNSYDDNKSREDYEEFSQTWFSNLQMVTDRQAVTLGTKNIQVMANLAPEVAGVACWVKKNWITSCHIAKLQQWEPIFFFGDFTKYKRSSDLFEINRKHQADVGDQHTCPKQIELLDEILVHYCDQSVVDLFGGSGTTLISAEKNDKTSYLIEMDPVYVDVIVKRWEGYTGKHAVLEYTQQTYEELKSERNRS
jgi:DNA modification methylase